MSHLFVVNVEAAIFKDDKFLIIKRSDKEEHAGGLYSLVGGKIDFNETSSEVLEENIQREVYEEIGIELNGNLKYVHSTTSMAGNIQVLNAVFLSEDFSGVPFAKSHDEIAELKWMEYDEIMRPNNVPVWTKNSVELSIKLLNKTINT